MLFGLFEKYSHTCLPSAAKGKFKPLVINMPLSRVGDSVLEELKNDQFYDIETNNDFGDIFGKKRGFELSIQLTLSGGQTILEMSVFGENKRGKTRKFFARYYLRFKKKFGIE